MQGKQENNNKIASKIAGNIALTKINYYIIVINKLKTLKFQRFKYYNLLTCRKRENAVL